MTATDIVLVLFIIALLAYAIYDEFIMPRALLNKSNFC